MPHNESTAGVLQQLVSRYISTAYSDAITFGILILVLERTGRIPDRHHLEAGRTHSLTAITYRQALIIGLAQCIALAPGTSRSESSIISSLSTI